MCKPRTARGVEPLSETPLLVQLRWAKEPMLLGLKPDLKGFEEKRVRLKAEGFRLHAELHGLEGISRVLKAEEPLLEPGEVGLEGEEQVLKAEERVFKGRERVLKAEEPLLKGEELFFEQPEPGLQETRYSVQPTAPGVAFAAWQPAQGGGFFHPPVSIPTPIPLLHRPSLPPMPPDGRPQTTGPPRNHAPQRRPVASPETSGTQKPPLPKTVAKPP